MPEPPKRRAGDRAPSKPAPRSGSAPPATAPKKKPNQALFYSAIGGGALLLVGLVVAAMMSGGPKKKAAEEPVAAEAPPAPKPKPKPAVPEPPPKSRKEVEEEMKKEADERRARFAAEEKKRAEEAEKKAREERELVEKEKKAIAEEEAARRRELAAGYETRRRERKAESQKRLDEARKAIEEDRKAEAERQKSLVRKMKDQKITLKMKNGLVLQNVIVQGMTRDEVKLAFQFEGAQAEQSFPVEFIDDRSYVEFLKAVYRGDGAAGLYEMGRYLVLRKLWKDAQAVFQDCVKADASYQARVPDLARILNNEAAFKGSARRIGSDQLLLQYDFSDAAMAQDFAQQQPGQLAVEGGELKLVARATSLWSLKDVDFERDVEADLTVILDETAALVVGAFVNWERKGYLAVLNSRQPGGHVLYRTEGSKLDPLGAQKEAKIPAGAEVRVRFQVRGGQFRVFVGEHEAMAVSDTAFQKGWFVLGASTGTVRLKKLSIQGHVNPAEIDKRFAEVEVLVRRALEADLGGRKKKASEDEIDPLWGEDEAHFAGLDPATKDAYDKARKALTQAMQRRRMTPQHLQVFDPVLAKAPGLAPAWFWRGASMLFARRNDEARRDFEKAASLDPEFVEAHYAVARACLEDRDLDAARAAAKKALEHSPGYGEAVGMQGFLRFLAGDAKGAGADLELARKLDPPNDWIATTQKNVLNVLKGPQHLGAKWVKEFPHYVVMTDMSMEKTILYGTRLEAAFKHYAETFKDSFKDDPKRPKPRVAVFNTREAYLTYGELTLSGRQEWTLGYFHPLYKELLLFEDVDQEATLQTLYHEAFHQFMAMMVAKTPFWYNEGIAEYMGGIRIDVPKQGASRIVERARILEGRLKGLRLQLPMVLKFEDIMMQSPSQFYSGPVPLKYAQAWSMVHFFHEAAGGKHRPRIDRYFKALHSGGDARAAFQAGFGDAPLDELQKEWLEYVKKLELPKK
jgi:tetratricopeptide (TPR) repeat protein